MGFNVKLELNQDKEFRNYIKELIRNHIKTLFSRETIQEIIDKSVNIKSIAENSIKSKLDVLLTEAIKSLLQNQVYYSYSYQSSKLLREYIEKVVKNTFTLTLDNIILDMVKVVMVNELENILRKELISNLKSEIIKELLTELKK